MASATALFRDLPFERRKEEASRMLTKYENRIPVIVVKHSRSSLPDIEQKKFLVPQDLTVSQFQVILRKRLRLDSAQAMFLFVEKLHGDGKKDHILLPVSDSMSGVYNTNKDPDGFLYLIYSNDDVFG
eukprot:m.18050 g.18050  ORF g.18050 m.18050 type:complete len:128 (-) comp7283_c1_seq1:204-587(-)